MARRLGPAKHGGGVLRTLERTSLNRGMFGGSKGFFYVGTGLWTLRKIRSMAERKTEILLSEELRPGQRLIIANGVATIEDVADQGSTKRRGRRRSRRA